MSPETEKFIKLLEKQLGYAEKKGGHTKFGAWYNSVESDADYSTQPWCDMYISWAAEKLGYEEWVGQFAWTPSHARWFEKQGAFGTQPERGALVFYDWSGGKKIGGIDHVGVVTGVKGRKILTIEGNIDGGVAKRKKRDQDKVVGYGYPEKVREALEAPVMPPDSVLGQAGQGTAMPQGPQVNVAPDIAARLISPRPLEPARGDSAARKSSAPSEPAKPVKSDEHKAAMEKPVPAASPRSRKGDDAPADDDRAAPARSSAPEPAPRAKVLPDTAPLTGSPLSAPGALQSPLPDLSSPVLLAPVLLAAIGLLAHARSRRLRAQAATGLAVRPVESAATPPEGPEPALAAAPILRHAPSAARHASATGTSGTRATRTSRTRGRHAAHPDLIIAPEIKARSLGRHAAGQAPTEGERHTPYRGRRRRIVPSSDEHASPAVPEQRPRGRRHRPVPSQRSPLPADRHSEWNWFHPATTAPPNRPSHPLHDPPHATRRGRHARP
ncbi:CHAP domain-containing protein [Spongiactinospora sp. 9N601]|uniref:CHAP domain-containing protein n=1 Tax=Spongiactinospora sp. 9N601 TaxID=3375149 RepID=UPI003789D4AA